MGLYEKMPYANFHELNLDKVMEVVSNIPSIIYDEVVKALETFPVPDGSVTTAKIANSAVTSAKIASNAVTTAKLNGSAVTTSKIANGAVTTDKLASGAVTGDKIEDEAVTFEKLAADMGTIITGTSPGATNIASGAGFKKLAEITLDPGVYLLYMWVNVVGASGSGVGVHAAKVCAEPDSSTDLGYGYYAAVNVPAYNSPVATNFAWSMPRKVSSQTTIYINYQQTTGITRSVRANFRAVRIK